MSRLFTLVVLMVAAEPSARVPANDGKAASDLGVGTKGGTFTPLIGRGTALPANHSEIVTTVDDNQPTIKADVFSRLCRTAGDQSGDVARRR